VQEMLQLSTMQQTLLLMVGYPGSGKTTASKLIHEQTGAVHLWADHERKLRFDNPTYTHEENLKLYDELNSRADTLLAEGKSVIFDTNFNFYKDRMKLRGIATKHGARTVVVWVVVPRELARQRAVHESHGQHTRVFGNMPLEHFERIARNLQPPRGDEFVVKLEGNDITPADITEALKSLQPG
jgi:predicted kinase